MNDRAFPGIHRNALVDLDAVVANALSAAGGRIGDCIADVRADAYGHGAARVARVLVEAGLTSVLASPGDADALRAQRLGCRVIDSLETTEPGGESVLGEDGETVHRLASESTGGQDRKDGSGSTGEGRRVLGEELYGVRPGTRPTLRLSGEVVSVKTVDEGSGVSYGYTYRTRRRTRLALIALGFADGVPRAASNRAPVLVGRFTGKVSGRVAMDQLVVDIGDAPAVVGDEAVLFGSADAGEPTLLDWASAIGLRPLVLLARIGPRVERHEGALR